MNLRRTLNALAKAVADEAEHNDRLREQLESIFGLEAVSRPAAGESEGEMRRKGGRRAAAVLDPVEVIRHGEDQLRRQLGALDIEQLRDIVAQYGMDPGKLVMKWKDAERVTDRIVELASARSRKGEAFRAD
jgi:hypothetical protein